MGVSRTQSRVGRAELVEEQPRGANTATASVGGDRGGTTRDVSVTVQTMGVVRDKVSEEGRLGRRLKSTRSFSFAPVGDCGCDTIVEGTEVDVGALRNTVGVVVNANNGRVTSDGIYN